MFESLLYVLEDLCSLPNNDNIHNHVQLFYFIAPLSLLYRMTCLGIIQLYLYYMLRTKLQGCLCQVGQTKLEDRGRGMVLTASFSIHIRPGMSDLSYHLSAYKVCA